MTDISVSKTAYQVDDRSWLLGPHGTGPGDNPAIVLDVSAFTPGTHYPDGYLLSGIPLGRITASGLYGPYDNALLNGQEVAAGLLLAAVKVPDTGDTTRDVGGALFVHGFVRLSRLPVALDAAGQADLRLIHFAA